MQIASLEVNLKTGERKITRVGAIRDHNTTTNGGIVGRAHCAWLTWQFPGGVGNLRDLRRLPIRPNIKMQKAGDSAVAFSMDCTRT